MPPKPGLASAVEGTSGVTTLASRFESPDPAPQTSSKVSDLATRFSQSSITPVPVPVPVPVPAASAIPAKKPSPKQPPKHPSPTLPKPTSPAHLSKKVSDLTRAFSSDPTAAPASSSSTFSAAQSAFSKAASESRVSAITRGYEGGEGPTAKVSGVARAFESMDTAPAFAPRLETAVRKEEAEKGKGKRVEAKVDGFGDVASRFERGVGGAKKEEEEEQGGQARERFLDAAKRFGG